MGTDPPTVQFPGHPQGVSPSEAWPGAERRGTARRGEARFGEDSGRGALPGCNSPALPPSGDMARQVSARIGRVGHGAVRHGVDGTVCRGTEQRLVRAQVRFPAVVSYGGKVRSGLVGQGMARRCLVRRGQARAAAARRGFGLPAALTWSSCGRTWSGSAGHGWAGRGSVRLAWPGQRQQGYFGTVQPVLSPALRGTRLGGSWRLGGAWLGCARRARRSWWIRFDSLQRSGPFGGAPGAARSGMARRGSMALLGLARRGNDSGAERGSIPRRRLAPSGARGRVAWNSGWRG